MRGKKHKGVPANAIEREDKKILRQRDQVPENKPVWRFSTVDLAGPFKWPKDEQAELTIVNKLHQLDSMYWKEIEGKQHHFLSPASLSKEAIERLKERCLDNEVEHLFSFHLQGKSRFIAIRHSNIAKLLWYDPNHEVAPSEKKHT